MQNLIPGVSWGKKMSQKQFDQMYQRMIHRQKKKEHKIQKQLDRKKEADLVNCTFHPKTNHAKTSRAKQSTSPRNSIRLDETGQSIQNKPLRKSANKSPKKTSQKFLARVEEMTRRDQQRKERTRQKYKEKSERNFQNQCTFQPNKKSGKGTSKRKNGDEPRQKQMEKDSQSRGNNFHQESENVKGELIREEANLRRENNGRRVRSSREGKHGPRGTPQIDQPKISQKHRKRKRVFGKSGRVQKAKKSERKRKEGT